jgi:O-acetyl-ADP-ribose deacetylase (regulator of RNase III)
MRIRRLCAGSQVPSGPTGQARYDRALTSIEVWVGDITRAPVEAIVNAANSQLWMGGGVAGAIKRAAGAEVEAEAMAQGPIHPGQAVVTSAGQLPPPIRWVIHAATMGPDLRTFESYIEAATASAFAAADQIGAKSVALPALGTGVGGFSMRRAAEIMVAQARRATRGDSSLEYILFVVRDPSARHEFEEELAAG